MLLQQHTLNSIFNYIYQGLITSQAWVAFCLALLVWFYQLINHWYNPHLIWLSFFSTLLAYNLAYWVEQRKRNWRLLVMIVSAIFSFYYYLQLAHWHSQILLLGMATISVLYSIPLQDLNLRKVPKLKIFWIALIWTFTILLSYIEHQQLNVSTFYAGMAVFFFVIGITIPFDLRDYYTDHTHLKTIPQQYGIIKSKLISVISLGLSLIFMGIIIPSQDIIYLWAYAITVLVAILLTLGVKKSNSRWYAAFWIEGLSALPFIIFKILSLLIS